MFHVGECALTLGISIVEAPIESARIMAIKVAKVLFFRLFIFLFSPILFVLRRSKNTASQQLRYLFF